MHPPLLGIEILAGLHERVLLYVLLDLAIIIIAAQALGAAARHIGQPPVIGKIVAGIVLGPTVLGLLNSSWPGEVFPPDVLNGPLKSLADLGLIFFMFLVGAEVDLRSMRRNLARSASISFSGILLPAVLGLAVGFALADTNGAQLATADREQPQELHFALFLAAAMCITAFPVLAAILKDTFLHKTDLGKVALGAAAVDDVCAWVLLAAVLGLVRSGTPGQAVVAMAETAVFAALMLTLGRYLLGRLERRYHVTQQLGLEQFAIVLAVVLFSATVTEAIGIEKIFGAFIAGVILPKPAGGDSGGEALEHGQGFTTEITRRVESFTEVAILPVFFLRVGLGTDLFRIDSVSLVGWLLLILAAAVAGKFIGCTLAARLSGATTKEAVVIGSLMNTRGLTEIVILTIGLKEGVLSEETFAMMVVMALCTTFMASPIINRLMPRREILAMIAEPEKPQVAPIASRTLVSVDNLLTAPALVDAAFRLTGSRRPAQIILGRLIPVPVGAGIRSGLDDEEEEIRASYAYFRRLEDDVRRRGLSIRSLSFETSHLVSDLVALAAAEQCDRVVLSMYGGPHGTTPNQALVSELLRARGPEVVVLGDRQSRGLRPEHAHVVIVQATAEADAATRVGTDLARQMNARVTLLGFLPPGTTNGVQGSRELALLADALSQESHLNVQPDFRASGAGAAAIELSAEADVIVLAAVEARAGTAAPSESFLRLLTAAACPVLGVRAPSEVASPAAQPPEAGAHWPFLPPAAERPAGAGEVLLPPGPHLQRLDPWGVPVEAWPLSDTVSIGRALDNHITLTDDELASRRHARIERTDGRYVIEDLDSLNGTLILRDPDWIQITREDLNTNDLIVIGSNVLRFSTA